MKPWVKRVGVALLALPLLAAASGWLYQQIATRRDLSATPPPGRLIDIGGHRLHIWCTGGSETNGPWTSGHANSQLLTPGLLN